MTFRMTSHKRAALNGLRRPGLLGLSQQTLDRLTCGYVPTLSLVRRGQRESR